MRQIEEERNARNRTAAIPPMGLGAPREKAQSAIEPANLQAPAAVASTRPAPPPERVTVLLVMKPGQTGIRRFGNKTADPVLCAGPKCWIGSGNARTARAVTRAMALGPANTMGPRAAACNRHLACVFRDIDLGGPAATIQPIDLRVLRHDRREPLRLAADPSCRLANGAIVCDKLFASRSWRAWVIDEKLAREAGPAALEAALANGLAQRPSATLAGSNF